MSTKKLISIVVPMLNEIDVVDAFLERTTAVMESLDRFDYEILAVDDGSTDGTCERLFERSESEPRLKILKLSRNFGNQIAITAGLDYARGDAVVVIDADLQDPPETIPELIAKWEEGYDVVYAVRARREGEGRMKVLSASAFYRVLRLFTKIDIPLDAGDFRLMSARAVKHLRELRETDRFVRGLATWIGFPQTGVTYERDERLAGATKYPFRKMLRFAVDAITSFSSVPLKFASWLGFLTSVVAFLYLLSVFVQKALGYTVAGWATIMVAMLFMGGVQLICIGIIGEYIGRIYTQVKSRPIYILEAVHSSSEEAEDAPPED